MSEWKTYKLGDICEDISYGYTESASWENVGPKFLRITDIQNDFINWNNVPYCPITKENHVKYRLEVGDIVIVRTGASTGVTTVFKDKDIDAVYASYLIRYRIDRTKADPFYIGHILKSILWKSHVNSIIGGSAQPGANANAKQFAAFEFLLSDLQTQSQIASILSSLDDKIELNLQMNQTLEAMAQAIFKEWFVNFNFPGFDGELADGLPKGWRNCSIGEVIYVQNGFAFKSGDFLDEGINGVIKIKNISNNAVDIVNVQFVPEEIASKVDNRFKVRSGDLLIAMTGAEVGKVGFVPNTDKNLWLNQRVGSFKEKVKYAKWFTYLILSSKEYRNVLLSSASGSAQPNISASQIERVEVLMPAHNLIESFGELVNPIFEKMLENFNQNQSLTYTRNSLLPKLMSGKIEIQA